MLNSKLIVFLLTMIVGPGFIPESHAARELGSVRFLSVDRNCARSGSDCWVVEVSCPALAPIQARLRIRYSTVTSVGTAIFAEGGSGVSFWGNQGIPASVALNDLNNAGFNTIEIAWDTSWWSDQNGDLSGNFDGYPTVACRPATLAKYIQETFNAGDPNLGFCASGNSGGSTQVAFMLSHYGLASILDLVIPTSGPPISRVDIGCFQTAGYESMWYTQGTAQTIDQVFRVAKNGPCVRQDLTYETLYRNTSVSVGGDYAHPTTHVHFVFGVNDTTSAVGQGLFHFDTLFQAGTPVGQEFIPGGGHHVHRSELGANAIRDKIIAECRKH